MLVYYPYTAWSLRLVNKSTSYKFACLKQPKLITIRNGKVRKSFTQNDIWYGMPDSHIVVNDALCVMHGGLRIVTVCPIDMFIAFEYDAQMRMARCYMSNGKVVIQMGEIYYTELTEINWYDIINYMLPKLNLGIH